MFSRIWTKNSTADYSDMIKRLKSAGFTYSGERFEKYFGDFIEKYRIPDMYSGGFYPYQTLKEYWA